jgi:hypothetical protein
VKSHKGLHPSKLEDESRMKLGGNGKCTNLLSIVAVIESKLKDKNRVKLGGNGKRTSLFSITAIKSFITPGPWLGP